MEEKTSEVLDKGIDTFFVKLTEVADKLTDQLVTAAPKVAEGLLNLVQFNAIFQLATCVLTMGLSAFAFAYCFKKVKTVNPSEISGYFFETMKDCYKFWTYFIPAVISVLIFFASSTTLFSFYYWVSSFYPEGGLALRALEAVDIKL